MQVIIAISTTTGGLVGRTVIEWQKGKIPFKRIFLIFISGTIVGYVNYELISLFNKSNWLGISSILSAMISVDLVLMFVKRSPSLIFKKATDYFKVKEEDNVN